MTLVSDNNRIGSGRDASLEFLHFEGLVETRHAASEAGRDMLRPEKPRRGVSAKRRRRHRFQCDRTLACVLPVIGSDGDHSKRKQAWS